MNGIILIDKPQGWTSHDVVASCAAYCMSGASDTQERLTRLQLGCSLFLSAERPEQWNLPRPTVRSISPDFALG